MLENAPPGHIPSWDQLGLVPGVPMHVIYQWAIDTSLPSSALYAAEVVR